MAVRQCRLLMSMVGWDGLSVTFTRSGGLVSSAVGSSGPSLAFGYTAGLLTSVTSSVGGSVGYTYYAAGLASVSIDGRVVHSLTADAAGRLLQLADASGIVLMSNIYDTLSRVTHQSSAAGAAVTFSYDTTGLNRNVTTMTDDVTGAVATFVFDKGARLLSAKDPLGWATAAEFDLAGNRTMSDSRSGGTVAVTFDDKSRPVGIVSDGIGSMGVVYDALGRVASWTDTFGRVTVLAYDGSERLPTTTTLPDNSVVTADVVNGLVMSMTDADGVTTTYTYDTQRRLASMTDELLQSTSFTYDARGRMLTSTAPDGGVTTNVYDSYGRLQSVTDPVGAVTSYSYDSADRLLTTTDPSGAVTANTYDSAGRLASTTVAGGSLTTYSYDAAGRVSTVTRPGGAVTSFGYDLLNRVTSTTDPLGLVTTFAYDAEGRRVRTVGPDGAVVSTTYNGGGWPVAETDGLGRTTRREYDAFGRVVKIVDPADQATAMTYDARDRVVSVVDVRGGLSLTSYSLAGRVLSSTDPAGVVLTNSYDVAGRLWKTVGPSGALVTSFDVASRPKTTTSPGGLVSSVTYDLAGRVLTATDPAGVVTTNSWSPRGELLSSGRTGAGTVSYTYLLNGLLGSVTDANGAVTSFGYDGRGNRLTRTNTLSGVDAWSYDLADQMVTSTDALGRVTSYTFGSSGQVASVSDPSARSVAFGYDLAGQLVSKTVAGGTAYGYSYDVLGRRTSVSVGSQSWATSWLPGDLLGSRSDPAGRTTSWTYDVAGRASAMVYPDGTSVGYTYDTASRLSTVKQGELLADSFTGVTGAGVDTAKWTATLTSGGTATVQANGARLAVTGTAGSTVNLASKAVSLLDSDTVVSYTAADTTATNAANLIVAARQSGQSEYRVTLPTTGTTGTISKKVSGVLTVLTSFTIPGTGTRNVRFQVQGSNLRVRVWQTGQAEPGVWTASTTSSSVTVAGKPAFAVARTTGVNSVTFDNWVLTNPSTPAPTIATYTWNNDGQHTAATLSNGSRTWTYTNGRVSNHTQTLAGVTTTTGLTYDSTGRLRTETSGGLTKTFGYDLADQLKTVSPSTGSVTTYSYDVLGRRTSVKVGASTTSSTFDAGSQLLTVGTSVFAYDGAGRRVSETVGATVTSYSYDPQGRLLSTVRGATTVSRGYDPDDNLVSVTNGATVSGIDWDPTSGIAVPLQIGGQRFVGGPDGWLQSRSGVTDTNIGRDVYGSVTSPTAVARAAGYDPFGIGLGANTFTPKLGYRGEITIDSLTYLRARNYDTKNGVFTSRDPLTGVAGTPVIASAYQYADNSPLTNTDPSGMSTISDDLYSTVVDGPEQRLSNIQVCGNYPSPTDVLDCVLQLNDRRPPRQIGGQAGVAAGNEAQVSTQAATTTNVVAVFAVPVTSLQTCVVLFVGEVPAPPICTWAPPTVPMYMFDGRIVTETQLQATISATKPNTQNNDDEPAKGNSNGQYSEKQLKEAERALRLDPRFRDWFHRDYKGDVGTSVGPRSNPDLDRDLVRDTYEEWLESGMPRGPR